MNHNSKLIIIFILFFSCSLAIADETYSKIESESPAAIIGEEPEEDLRQFFLRQSAVLLKPHEKEIGVSLNYTRTQYFNGCDREFRIPLSLRIGLAERVEGFVDVPLIWREHEDYLDNVNKNDAYGIGDISWGLKYSLLYQDKHLPDIIGAVSGNVPTGKQTDEENISLGGRQWQISSGLIFIKAYDPAVLFGGITYTHYFDTTINDVKVSGAKTFSYNFGMGFALNNKLTLSGVFIGKYLTGIKYEGLDLPTNSTEPMVCCMAVTCRLSRTNIIEPSITFGLNEDASDAMFSLSYTYKF